MTDARTAPTRVHRTVEYEWAWSEIDSNGDAVDITHQDGTEVPCMPSDPEEGHHWRLELVRDVLDHEEETVMDRSWAEVDLARKSLPMETDDGHRVPKRFARLLAKASF